ncbi:hypothetical protein ABK040_007705 [Willaertia magna]
MDVDVLVMRGNIINYEDLRTNTLLLAAYSGNHSYLEKLDKYDDEEDTIIDELIEKLPAAKAEEFNTTTKDAENHLDEEYDYIKELIEEGEGKEAVAYIYENPNFLSYKNQYKQGIDMLLDYILKRQDEVTNLNKVLVLVSLIIIAIAILAFLPAVVMIFAFAINRDSMYNDRWKKANALLLIDTLNNDRLRHLFKNYCKQEHSVENYCFLEEIQEYKTMCDEIVELQMKFFDDSTTSGSEINNIEMKHSSSASTSTSTVVTDIHVEIKKDKTNSKIPNVSEQDLEELENRKYEKALNIYKKYLTMEGEMTINISKHLVTPIKERLDMFEKKSLSMLPEDLFKNLESEISIVMLDTHQRFKQSIAFKKEMKIEKIKSHFKTDATSTH